MVIQSCYLYPCTRRQLDELTYEKLADETLDELASFFEDLGDSGLCHKDYDTQFSVSNLTPRPFLHGSRPVNEAILCVTDVTFLIFTVILSYRHGDVELGNLLMWKTL